MGSPCIRWIVPVMALLRLSADLERVLRLMTAPDGSRLSSKARVESFFKRDLHRRCEGTHPQQCSAVPTASAWLHNGTSIFFGKDFVSAVHVCYNCLFCKSRAARGHDTEKFCSRGCRVTETLNHISQQCCAPHGLRIKRHDALSNYFGNTFGKV